VQVVDVTREVVALFEPSERTLAMIADLAKQVPVALDEIDRPAPR
jgi:hypothetical protein